MGVVGSMKVVTGSERRARPELIQPGNREWVTVIQSICANGSSTPPFIIYKAPMGVMNTCSTTSVGSGPARDWAAPAGLLVRLSAQSSPKHLG